MLHLLAWGLRVLVLHLLALGAPGTGAAPAGLGAVVAGPEIGVGPAGLGAAAGLAPCPVLAGFCAGFGFSGGVVLIV